MFKRICLTTLYCGRRFAKFVLPYGIVGMIQGRAPRASNLPRRALRVGVGPSTQIPISAHSFVEVYWVNEKFGPGPGASVYVHGDEVMRLDAFGGSRGHIHLNVDQVLPLPEGATARIYFEDGDVFSHIERSVFELKFNLAYALKTNRNPSIHGFRVDPQALAFAAERMRDAMLNLVEKHGTAAWRPASAPPLEESH
jgi:hypothetical protein